MICGPTRDRQAVIYDRESSTKAVKEISEQEVYMGEIPLMTENGTSSSMEAVIVSQLHRSPGVFFSHDSGKTHSSGKLLYNAGDPVSRFLARLRVRSERSGVRSHRPSPQAAGHGAHARAGFDTEQILDMFFDNNVFHLGEEMHWN